MPVLLAVTAVAAVKSITAMPAARFDDPSSVNVAPLVAARCGSTVTPLTVRRVGSNVSVNWPDVTPPVDVPAMSEMGMPRQSVYVPPLLTPRPDAAVKVKLAPAAETTTQLAL